MTPPAVVVEPSEHGGWVVRCPWCHRCHFHGQAALGARLSHCRDVRVRQQYVLVRPATGRRSTTKKESP